MTSEATTGREGSSIDCAASTGGRAAEMTTGIEGSSIDCAASTDGRTSDMTTGDEEMVTLEGGEAGPEDRGLVGMVNGNRLVSERHAVAITLPCCEDLISRRS
jgi:hypothetical protein